MLVVPVSHSVHLPFCGEEGGWDGGGVGGGVEPPTKFSKRGSLTGPSL